eukprot:CAMPEP_0176484416 /NCGR_PEP_ID=MMETSP0200_2-20121128/4442_1 /TAXON_ID=947934 /ORGANISM="Chaetoceros sp., Strain GSL56" /LENGTH=768 /DNA_ID=CAMNT_0017880887 /DNA_START=92 /DNA_END=2395 /DNA_ORIENTATION=-
MSQEHTSRIIRRIGIIFIVSSHAIIYSHLFSPLTHVSLATFILHHQCQSIQGYLTYPATIHHTFPPTRRIIPFVSNSNTLTVGTHSPKRLRVLYAISNREEEDDDEDDTIIVDTWDDWTFSRNDLENLTVSQLRQQLRLRGLKISGKKSELVDRLLMLNAGKDSSSRDDGLQTVASNQSEATTTTTTTTGSTSKAQQFAQAYGKEFVDVTEYLEEEDRGKDTKTFKVQGETQQDGDDIEIKEKSDSSPETWGSEAKIVDDYEGRSVIVDGLSRTIVEFKGSNKKPVNAYVVASREALKIYLTGGDRGNNATDLETATKNLQLAKEKACKVPMKLEDEQGEDIDDEEGYYKNILDRDYGDWGKYSMTGAQLSSQEINGVLLLSDVRGPFCDDMRALADKIAFECQPVVVFAPDLFRGKPWEEEKSNPGYNAQGESYEEWRSLHPEDRVSVDIRAAAAALREQYGVSSISLFGTCYGGGRALEATARVYPYDTLDDVNREEGPTHVDPSTTIAWYPTRYDAETLFGEKKNTKYNMQRVNTAIMAIFGSEDPLPGATPDDALKLKKCLESDPHVKDYMVKVFPGQKHGFAHVGLSNQQQEQNPETTTDRFLKEEFGGPPMRSSVDDGDAEVASLLSTAWMETYSRQFLPTIGEAVKDDEVWSDIEMPDLSQSSKRDIRSEIEQAINEHEDMDLDLRRMHPDDFKTPIADMEDMDEDFYKALQTSPYGASLEDDPDTFLRKLEEAIDRGDLDYLPGFGEIPLDDSVDGPAYW